MALNPRVKLAAAPRPIPKKLATKDPNAKMATAETIEIRIFIGRDRGLLTKPNGELVREFSIFEAKLIFQPIVLQGKTRDRYDTSHAF
jgi:hypothetical protein